MATPSQETPAKVSLQDAAKAAMDYLREYCQEDAVDGERSGKMTSTAQKIYDALQQAIKTKSSHLQG